jgi:hypothetical protein
MNKAKILNFDARKQSLPPVQRTCLTHGLPEMIDCPCGQQAHCCYHTPGQRVVCRFEASGPQTLNNKGHKV